MKLHIIGNVSGSGTSFLPGQIIQRIKANTMKWIMITIPAEDVEIPNLISKELNGTNLNLVFRPN